VISRFIQPLAIEKFNLCMIAIIMFTLLFFSGLYAAGYDFNRFSGLAKQKYGDEAFKIATDLNQLVMQLKSAPEAEKLKQVNDFFNRRIEFADDIFIWGTNDYWASPLEFIGRGAGDCEDFTIAKYIFLKILNVPNEKLRLTYVKAQLPLDGAVVVRAHMVLSYYATPQSDPLILDNLIPNITPASSRNDLTPIFTFNDKGLWVGNSTKPKGDATTHLSKWRDLLVRIGQDGLE
jgi:predicted transglutaminase-like cysteine proteinase